MAQVDVTGCGIILSAAHHMTAYGKSRLFITGDNRPSTENWRPVKRLAALEFASVESNAKVWALL